VSEASGTEARVCEDIANRQALGTAKYGTTVEQNRLSLREWLQHLYCELLDAAIYTKRSIEEIDKKGTKE
jgi:molybdopterin/thiamine biosynthesis adenylyltransferase